MILKKPFFPFLFLVILLFGTLQQLAIHFYWYWVYPWFDIPMHLLGGFCFGFLAVWILFFSGYVSTPNRRDFKYFLLVALSVAFVVGIIWEIFEYYGGITFWVDGYVLDTIKDLVMDTLGAFVSAVFLYKAYKKQIIKNDNHVIS